MHLLSIIHVAINPILIANFSTLKNLAQKALALLHLFASPSLLHAEAPTNPAVHP